MNFCVRVFLVGVVAAVWVGSAIAAENPFVGRWALTIPGGRAGWLGITDEGGYFDGSILWGGGSVVPLASVYFEGDKMVATRLQEVERKDSSGKVVRKQTFTDEIVATVDGDRLSLVLRTVKRNGMGVREQKFDGKRIPAMPPAPKLASAKYGDAVELFNGKNLQGWALTNSNQKNGWSVENGVMANNPVQPEGGHISYGNLQTVETFEDFNLQVEVKVPPNGNSGIYLRGIYEVQVLDSYGKPADTHHMGAVYSRIKPSATAEKPAGEWQTLDITLMDRHITVVLNGTKIIDNEPLLGCTGGALWSDEFRPGPIYLQGDHTGVSYRKLTLRPILN